MPGPRRRPPDTARAARAPDAISKILAVVRRVPRGSVVTYGEVAALAGFASGHRVAARALRDCPEGLPWYRVLGKKDARRAHISIEEPVHAELQRARLEAEGVRFDEGGCVKLAEHGWLWQRERTATKRTAKKRTAKRAAAPAPAPSTTVSRRRRGRRDR